MIVGPGVSICDECVEVCMNVIEENYPAALHRISDQLKEKLFVPPKDFENLGLKPRFSKPRLARRDNHCFYVCPFSEPFNTVYSDHSKPSIESAGFSVERADEIFGTEPIIEDIWQGINAAEIVIADVTERNPNVMYEIGMAHTVGRPVVIITQQINDVPFDLKHYRSIIYSYTPRGCKNLEAKLIRTLQFLRGKSL